MSKDIFLAIEQIERLKGIPREILKQAVEAALLSAYRKNFRSSHRRVSVVIDPATGEIRIYSRKTVVEEARDASCEVGLAELSRLKISANPGEEVEIEITPRDFGRISAQTAKQVIMQRIREAERTMVFDEFSGREEDIVTGIVNRKEGKNIIVDLEKTEALLPANEQVESENYRINARMKFYVVEVRKTSKGPQILLSRTHPGLVRRLFEFEIPEVQEGFVDVKAIAREPGIRTKIAVESRDERIDPVGACIGSKGARVKHITDELRGEKIDIVKWNSDPRIFIAGALSPARVTQVELDPENRVAKTYVPEDQLSLAIGKEGQNARLAARLTGWKIDIKS
ncbi:MAG TPA: transcription termination factor NusA [Atribacteraceae bacterium]|nr:transcription termination factor NusA [Atribacteraceae bacterium]